MLTGQRHHSGMLSGQRHHNELRWVAECKMTALDDAPEVLQSRHSPCCPPRRWGFQVHEPFLLPEVEEAARCHLMVVGLTIEVGTV